MTTPEYGIAAKYLEKGRHGDGYLRLTIGKARAFVASRAPLRRRKVYVRRRGVVSLG